MNRHFACLLILGVVPAHSALAQYAPGRQGSSNMEIVAHIPVGGPYNANDLEIEQELSRPYVYVSRREPIHGFHVISLRNLDDARVIYSWALDGWEEHVGKSLDIKYFKTGGRYYAVVSFQFRPGSPDVELGAIVFDVTGLPDTTGIREVGRIRAADTPGGFHNIYAYRHSNGQVLLFATVSGPHAKVYDMEQLLAGDPRDGLIATIPNPSGTGRGYHDFFVGFDPATRQDKFYGGGRGGYYVYDVSNIRAPELLASATGIAGITSGHTFTPTPDGRYAVLETEYQYAPLRIIDLKPALDGEVQNISRPIGAWTARWKGLPHNHEVRWPYVFVSAYEDGVHVFNIMDPTNPYTVAYYDSYEGAHEAGLCGSKVCTGSFGIDVRNADGLIVTADMYTGFWAFKMDGFDGWNGHQWGMPNISSVQDWDNGPDGAPSPARVSARE